MSTAALTGTHLQATNLNFMTEFGPIFTGITEFYAAYFTRLSALAGQDTSTQPYKVLHLISSINHYFGMILFVESILLYKLNHSGIKFIRAFGQKIEMYVLIT